jgi:hypothetical protein
MENGVSPDLSHFLARKEEICHFSLMSSMFSFLGEMPNVPE